jgi:hypothetical protein
VIVHQRRHEDIGDADAARLPEIIEAIFGDLRGERRALVPPIGEQLVEADRIDHGAGEDVTADLRTLLQDDDRNLLPLLAGELLQPDRSSQPGPPPTMTTSNPWFRGR